ncbi:universal stress protein [Mucilaginibacter ginsenosidivorans]|jgi:nucleotide-binding universal stress UspA family protein|nr:universal stress protein [Mucilaginibacter ginsenosidivorans]
MKILIATDFSATAAHAAEYGYLLAKQLKAGVFLCNTIVIPAEVPVSGIAFWSQGDSDTLLADSTEELKQLKAHLQQNDHTNTFRPPVDYINESGTVWYFVNNSAFKQQADVIIAGTHEEDGLGSLLSGNHTIDLIETCIRPLLIIPRTAAFKPIKKIAFATDLEYPENDLQQLYDLIKLAKMLDAEILLTHIKNEADNAVKFEKRIEKFLAEVSDKADYHKIYHRIINQDKVESGLDWLCEHAQIDILAMAHREHGLLENIFKGSHTKRMAGHIAIPLLVYPGTNSRETI